MIQQKECLKQAAEISPLVANPGTDAIRSKGAVSSVRRKRPLSPKGSKLLRSEESISLARRKSEKLKP